jgi:hypothetical protein
MPPEKNAIRRASVAITAMLLLITAVSGCSEQKGSSSDKAKQPAIAAVVTSAEAVRPAYTKADWLNSIEANYSLGETRQAGDGVTESIACFPAGTTDCQAKSFFKFDAFRKLRHYTPLGAQLGAHAHRYLQTYIALPDCKSPLYILRPKHFSSNGWLFLNRVAIMADNQIVLDHPIPHHEVEKEVYPGGVEEQAAFVVSNEQLNALRGMHTAAKISIRLTGEKGYSMVKPEDAAMFIKDTKAALTIYDTLTQAAERAMPSSCP